MSGSSLEYIHISCFTGLKWRLCSYLPVAMVNHCIWAPLIMAFSFLFFLLPLHMLNLGWTYSALIELILISWSQDHSTQSSGLNPEFVKLGFWKRPLVRISCLCNPAHIHTRAIYSNKTHRPSIVISMTHHWDICIFFGRWVTLSHHNKLVNKRGHILTSVLTSMPEIEMRLY